jgi:hypothetical protein
MMSERTLAAIATQDAADVAYYMQHYTPDLYRALLHHFLMAQRHLIEPVPASPAALQKAADRVWDLLPELE